MIRQIQAGDEQAKTLLYETYAPRLYPICVHFLGYRDPDAEDMVQETFLLALGNLAEFEGRSSLYTWLARICVHLCYRQLHKRERLLVSAAEDLDRMSLPVSESRDQQLQEEEENRFRVKRLERLSQSLSEKCRGMLELRERQEKSYIEIARTFKMPIGTVMSQLARCREALKRLAENEMKGGPV